MNGEKNINYSAADIERYNKRLMSPAEMHALEKAALDDPFLMDAIEGYASLPVNTQADITLLNEKLDERIEGTNVVPVKKLNFTWLRVAALFIIIAGAALLTYNNVFFQKGKNDVAAIEKKDTVTTRNSFTDTIITPPTNLVTETGKKEKEPATKNNIENKKEVAVPVAKVAQSAGEKETAEEQKQLNNIAAAPVQTTDKPLDDKEVVNQKDEALKKTSARSAPQKNAAAVKIEVDQSYDKAKTLNEVTSQSFKPNYFRGQVIDANNSPLPFANVTIVPDNIGTYTDVKGNFTLIAPDSTLEVKIRSVGFENNTVRLQNNGANNSIVLQQDTNIPSTVLNTQKTNTERKRQDNMTLEEPEPADGWYNYDTYIANNIKISDAIKTKTTPSSEVQLSFEINKYGEPVNIKVEKSACKECDAEAIRLLKEGPKWKNKKNKKAKVSVAFSQIQE